MRGREEVDGENLELILVTHGSPRSADVLARLLSDEGFRCELLPDTSALASAIQEDTGAAIVEGGLLAHGVAELRRILDAQPVWSVLPVLVLTSPGRHGRHLASIAGALGQHAAVTLLEQPARGFEVVSLVRGALSTRRRQYDLRDYLERERELIAALEASREDLRQLNRTLEQRVEDGTRQVRELARALTRAEHRERRRVSQILHDDLQQQLYGVQMKMSRVMRYALANQTEAAARVTSEARQWLERAVVITRSLTVELSPPILKREGLADALFWLQTQMRELHGLNVAVVAGQAFSTPDTDLRVLIFQIVRELLFNVVKHAETGHAVVTLRKLDHHIEIQVADEGKGFDLELAETGPDASFGLFNIRERLQLFGGQMAIDSAPGKGTRITLTAPLDLE